MVKTSKVKITVLKKLSSRDVFGGSPPMGQATEACGQFDVGQEFIVGEDGGMPEGFCHWAWNDMYKVVTTLMFGGSFSEKRDTPIVRCCTDGLRPVIFKLERI
jgi:uncharacterized repeat protein (TIGR04076 family)